MPAKTNTGESAADGRATPQHDRPRVAPDHDPISPVEQLQGLDLHELRRRWRAAFGRKAPAHLTRTLLLRILAYQLQAEAKGDLSRETRRMLDQLARSARAERQGGNKDGRSKRTGGAADLPPLPELRRLLPGTELVREHSGVLHRVSVLADGYGWNGAVYGSLSHVARAITGTRWNGHRFFGLKTKPSRLPAAASDRLTTPASQAGAPA